MDETKRDFFKVAGLAGLGLSTLTLDAPRAKEPETESVYDRVLRPNLIRCGYTLYSVGLSRDPNTGALRGIYKDILEEAASRLSLKVEWVEEVSWATQIEGLNTGRYDLVGSPVSVTGPRSRAADYSIPLYYSPVGVWAASSSHVTGITQLDDPAIRIATIDGEQTQSIAKAFFPRATIVSLPQSAEFSELLMTVTGGKADVTFAEPFAVAEFMEHNGKTLKNVSEGHPLQIVPNIIMMRHGEPEFKFMINNVLTELFLGNVIDRALDRHETYPNSYIRSKGYF
jgi:ABC-type amino acid transport substrate-binding protein